MIHNLAHANAAAAAAAGAGRAITMASAPGAAGYAGAAWFAQVIAQSRAANPAAQIEAVLDCADMAGWALAAIRDGGVNTIRLTASAVVVAKIRAIARKQGIRVVTGGADPCLDLHGIEMHSIEMHGSDDIQAVCRDWIEATPRRRSK